MFLPEMPLKYMMLPEVLASQIPNAVTVGQALPVQGPIVIVAEVTADPLEGVENVA